ncbi:MAG: Na/Pi cotransporter family protein, partial [bacterium]|nr:Na/Pi cotransporter family protein [bacterium]
ISLALQDLIGLPAAITLILGSNIGTCITAMLASIGASLTARRAALSHVLFNVFGVLLFLPFIGQFSVFISGTALTVAKQAANAHTMFNVINVLVFLPFIRSFSRLVIWMMPGKEVVFDYTPKFLDVNLLNAPSIALGQATKELVHMGGIVVSMLEDVSISFNYGKSEILKNVVIKEKAINQLDQDVVAYLVQISQKSLSLEQSNRLNALFNVSNDIERIGDHAENIMELAEYKIENRLPFSPEALKELEDMNILVRGLVVSAIEALSTDNFEVAREVIEREQGVDDLEKHLRARHIQRLNEGFCHPASGVVFLDAISNYERVADHANNIAEVVIK